MTILTNNNYKTIFGTFQQQREQIAARRAEAQTEKERAAEEKAKARRYIKEYRKPEPKPKTVQFLPGYRGAWAVERKERISREKREAAKRAEARRIETEILPEIGEYERGIAEYETGLGVHETELAKQEAKIKEYQKKGYKVREAPDSKLEFYKMMPVQAPPAPKLSGVTIGGSYGGQIPIEHAKADIYYITKRGKAVSVVVPWGQREQQLATIKAMGGRLVNVKAIHAERAAAKTPAYEEAVFMEYLPPEVAFDMPRLKQYFGAVKGEGYVIDPSYGTHKEVQVLAGKLELPRLRKEYLKTGTVPLEVRAGIEPIEKYKPFEEKIERLSYEQYLGLKTQAEVEAELSTHITTDWMKRYAKFTVTTPTIVGGFESRHEQAYGDVQKLIRPAYTKVEKITGTETKEVTWKELKIKEPAIELKKTDKGFETYLDITAWKEREYKGAGILGTIRREFAKYLGGFASPEYIYHSIVGMPEWTPEKGYQPSPHGIESYRKAEEIITGWEYQAQKKIKVGDIPGLALSIPAVTNIMLPMGMGAGLGALKALAPLAGKVATGGLAAYGTYTVGKEIVPPVIIGLTTGDRGAAKEKWALAATIPMAVISFRAGYMGAKSYVGKLYKPKFLETRHIYPELEKIAESKHGIAFRGKIGFDATKQRLIFGKRMPFYETYRADLDVKGILAKQKVTLVTTNGAAVWQPGQAIYTLTGGTVSRTIAGITKTVKVPKGGLYSAYPARPLKVDIAGKPSVAIEPYIKPVKIGTVFVKEPKMALTLTTDLTRQFAFKAGVEGVKFYPSTTDIATKIGAVKAKAITQIWELPKTRAELAVPYLEPVKVDFFVMGKKVTVGGITRPTIGTYGFTPKGKPATLFIREPQFGEAPPRDIFGVETGGWITTIGRHEYIHRLYPWLKEIEVQAIARKYFPTRQLRKMQKQYVEYDTIPGLTRKEMYPELYESSQIDIRALAKMHKIAKPIVKKAFGKYWETGKLGAIEFGAGKKVYGLTPFRQFSITKTPRQIIYGKAFGLTAVLKGIRTKAMITEDIKQFAKPDIAGRIKRPTGKRGLLSILEFEKEFKVPTPTIDVSVLFGKEALGFGVLAAVTRVSRYGEKTRQNQIQTAGYAHAQKLKYRKMTDVERINISALGRFTIDIQDELLGRRVKQAQLQQQGQIQELLTRQATALLQVPTYAVPPEHAPPHVPIIFDASVERRKKKKQKKLPLWDEKYLFRMFDITDPFKATRKVGKRARKAVRKVGRRTRKTVKRTSRSKTKKSKKRKK